MKNLKKSLFLAVATVAMASVGSAATIAVVPTQSYGAPVFGSAGTPVWVSLSSLATLLSTSITAGTTSLNFTAVGQTCFNPGASTCAVVGDQALPVNPILGGFVTTSGSTSFLSTSLPQFDTVASGDWSNNFSNDFVVAAAGTGNVLVPATAAWVVFVFRDNFYNDNVDNAPVDLGVNVTVSNPTVAPEPATYAMMLAGLGAVAAFKRLRRS